MRATRRPRPARCSITCALAERPSISAQPATSATSLVCASCSPKIRRSPVDRCRPGCLAIGAILLRRCPRRSNPCRVACESPRRTRARHRGSRLVRQGERHAPGGRRLSSGAQLVRLGSTHIERASRGSAALSESSWESPEAMNCTSGSRPRPMRACSSHAPTATRAGRNSLNVSARIRTVWNIEHSVAPISKSASSDWGR
jgi:hypothetical protein